MVETGTGLVQLTASRSMCWRTACDEQDWTVVVRGNVRRKVRVANPTVNAHIVSAMTSTRQNCGMRFGNRRSGEGVTEYTLLECIIPDLVVSTHQMVAAQCSRSSSSHLTTQHDRETIKPSHFSASSSGTQLSGKNSPSRHKRKIITSVALISAAAD